MYYQGMAGQEVVPVQQGEGQPERKTQKRFWHEPTVWGDQTPQAVPDEQWKERRGKIQEKRVLIAEKVTEHVLEKVSGKRKIKIKGYEGVLAAMKVVALNLGESGVEGGGPQIVIQQFTKGAEGAEQGQVVVVGGRPQGAEAAPAEETEPEGGG
jgi:hypothetical protein